MRVTPLFLVLLLSAGSLAAQGGRAGTTATFVARLGRDTVALERVTRTAARVEGDLFTVSPRARRAHYLATLDAQGHVVRFEVLSNPAVETPPAPVIHVVTEMHDSIGTLVLTRGSAKPDTSREVVRPGAVPYLTLSIAMLEQMTLQWKRSGKDSVAIDALVAGLPRIAHNYVARRGRDSVAIDYFGDPMYVRVDGSGRVLGLNGARTTEKWVIDRAPALNLDQLADMFIARERAGQVAGALSTRDTARASIGGGTLWIDYGRPSKRGRQILGGIVPWNEVWRTGANAATQFSTSVDLQVGDQVIAAGTYTLWTLPTAQGVTLLINKQTGQWGTEHDPARDAYRLTLRAEELPEVQERLAIAIVPLGKGGELRIDWDRIRWVLPFTVR